MNYNTNQSIFIQIAERICDRVLSGNYKADSRIPSVRELAVEMEVNPNTVMRSFERLQANDIIYNKRGIGYFVASDAEQKIREMRHNQFVEVDTSRRLQGDAPARCRYRRAYESLYIIYIYH